jgi:hypothetical protein
MFAIDFCAQLALYRLSLDYLPAFSAQPTPNQAPVLLILAGDMSRMNLVASLVFRACNVDVLILPGATAQALHPVEAVINRPLNRAYKDQLKQQVSTGLGQLAEGQLVEVEALRCSMVAAFLNAFRKETCPDTVYRAFEATGFVPFNPARPRESLVRDSGPTDAYDAVVRRSDPVPAQLLTDADSIAARFAEETGRPITQGDVTGLNLDEIWDAFTEATLDRGRILTQRRKIWMLGGPRDAIMI